jgi:hypothetical protein
VPGQARGTLAPGPDLPSTAHFLVRHLAVVDGRVTLQVAVSAGEVQVPSVGPGGARGSPVPCEVTVVAGCVLRPAGVYDGVAAGGPAHDTAGYAGTLAVQPPSHPMQPATLQGKAGLGSWLGVGDGRFGPPLPPPVPPSRVRVAPGPGTAVEAAQGLPAWEFVVSLVPRAGGGGAALSTPAATPAAPSATPPSPLSPPSFLLPVPTGLQRWVARARGPAGSLSARERLVAAPGPCDVGLLLQDLVLVPGPSAADSLRLTLSSLLQGEPPAVRPGTALGAAGVAPARSTSPVRVEDVNVQRTRVAAYARFYNRFLKRPWWHAPERRMFLQA